MSARVTVLTAFTGAETPGARVLARGLKARHPDWRVCGVAADRLAAMREPFDRVIEAEALFGTDWRAFAFRHEAADIAGAVRGRALEAALAEGADIVVCFSTEIAVFADLTEIVRRLETASVLLTPHQAEPNQGARAIADHEARALESGVFSLGFLAVRNDASGRALARWWAARLDAGAYDDAREGLFDDARHFDLAPALFDGVAVWRDPGAHVASWNLSRREIAISEDGRILVNGEHPLLFYDFSNPYGDGGIMTERYAGRRLGVYELQAWYRRACAAEAGPAPGGEWAYDRFEDGSAVTGAARRLYRADPTLATRFPDPFAAGPESYLAWLRTHRPEAL